MERVPFLGHNHYDALDVSPDSTPPRGGVHDARGPDARARVTVHRFALDADDEAMLLDLLGLNEADRQTDRDTEREVDREVEAAS